jgi:hypothetical protein
VGGAFEQGHYFTFASGTGSVLNLTKNDRTLIDFRPLTISTDSTTPLTYNITIIKGGARQQTIRHLYRRAFSQLVKMIFKLN